jgi:hypothetical protein
VRATEHILTVGESVEDRKGEGVSLWEDSVGGAARQLGVVLALAIALHYACGLLLRL